MTRPTFLSLFSGIGGLDLGLERAGWECVGQVENNPYCTRVLAKRWPEVPRWGDIKELDPDGLPRADLVCGGFPCQPFSNAGKRWGTTDERWLWPEAHRVVRHLRPRWVLLENVPGFLARYGGMGDVLGDLAASGYDAEWDCIPAAAVGAPHLRYRVFVVAYPQGKPGALRGAEGERPGRLTGSGKDVAYPDQGGRDGRPRIFGPRGRGEPADGGAVEHPPGFGGQPDGWFQQPGNGHPQRHVPQWQPEPDVGRMVDGVPARVDRLRGLGNAVVPQVAELIGRRLLEADVA